MERMEKVILSTVCMRLEFLNFHVEGHWMVISHFKFAKFMLKYPARSRNA